MSKLRNDVITQALRNLFVIAEGQTVNETDVQKLDLIADGVFAELAGLSIYNIGDRGEQGPSGGDFADDAYLSIADYLAWRGLSAFPMDASGQVKIVSAKDEAIHTLRALSGAPRGCREVKFDRGMVRRTPNWAIWPNNF